MPNFPWFPWMGGEMSSETTPFDPSKYSGVYNAVTGGGNYGMGRQDIESMFEQNKTAMMAPYLEQIRAQAAEQGRRPGAGGAMPGVDLQAMMTSEAQNFALPKMSAIFQGSQAEAGRKAGLAGQMIGPSSYTKRTSTGPGGVGGGGQYGGQAGREGAPGATFGGMPQEGGNQGFGSGGIADVLLAHRIGLPSGLNDAQARLMGHFGVRGVPKRGDWGAGTGVSRLSNWPG